MYPFSPQGYCRGHLVKRLSCTEETGREWGGVLIILPNPKFKVLNSKQVIVSAVTQHFSAVTTENVIALTETALTFTH